MLQNTYISDNFLLTNALAEHLYHESAKNLPIVDFHNHLSPLQIVENTQSVNLAQVWVVSDPYKHRAMRINGVPEHFITGNATDKEKFLKWAATVPFTLGNPLHQWSHLELKRIFGIDKLLDESTAEEVWVECNEQISLGKHSTRNILKLFHTEILCTSDELLDDVSVHQRASTNGVNVFPSLRTDSLFDFSTSFITWVAKLAKLTSIKIYNLVDYEAALRLRIQEFSKAGCRLVDQSLDAGFKFEKPNIKTAESVFKKLLEGNELNEEEKQNLYSFMLCLVGRLAFEQKWTLQLHIGAQRQTSTRLKKLVGGAGGFAAMGTNTDIATLVKYLDTLEIQGNLPNVILYNLNAIDNAAFATLTGSFSEDSTIGKIQFGPAWWYNDHYEGIMSQLKALTAHGLLSRSIGMTTDSRSFYSLSRHEYFRRILCQFISEWVLKGILPNDIILLSNLVKNISYNNPKLMFI